MPTDIDEHPAPFRCARHETQLRSRVVHGETGTTFELWCPACRRYRSNWKYGERPAGAPPRCKDCGVIFEGGRRVCDRCAEKRRIAKRRRRALGVSHNSA